MSSKEFILAQLRHAYHHSVEGREKACREVVASCIRFLENEERATKFMNL